MTRIDPAELARLVEKLAELLPQAPLNVGGPDGLSIDNDGDPPFEDGHFVKWLSRGEDSAVIAVIVPIDARDAGLALSDLIALAPTMAAAITTLVENTRLEYEGGLAAVARAEQAEARLREIAAHCADRLPDTATTTQAITRERAAKIYRIGQYANGEIETLAQAKP